MSARALSWGLTAALAIGGWLALAQSRPETRPVPVKDGQAKGWPVKFENPSDEELKKRLTPLQYQVTQAEGTEPPFRN